MDPPFPTDGTHNPKAKMIEIEGANFISSVCFLADGKHIFGGGFEGNIRRWQVEDGSEEGGLMTATIGILGLTSSKDGHWIVNGTEDGRVMVWNAADHAKVREFDAHPHFAIETVDVSLDGTRIATGAHDATVCVWSLSSGERLVGPLQHEAALAAVKYSFDGLFLATATYNVHSVRIYDSLDGRLITNIPAKVDTFDRSLCWSRNSKYLFVLAAGRIKCLDVARGTTFSEWSIHSNNDPRGIALSENGKFILAAANSSVSFWDTTTHEEIGHVKQDADILFSMAVSPNYDFVTSGAKSIIVRRLNDILPSCYCDDITSEWLNSPITMESVDPEETVKSLLSYIHDLQIQQESSQGQIAKLENTIEELRTELAQSRQVVDQEKNDLKITIESLRARDENSDRKITRLEALVRSTRSSNSPAGRRYLPYRPSRS